MPWPNDTLSTTTLDSNTDRPSRLHFLALTNAVKALIGGRSTANGVAPLDAASKVPAANLPRGDANGVAPLDAASKVPAANLPRGDAGGVAPLDAASKVPAANLPRGDANGVAPLDAAGKVPAANLALSIPYVAVHRDATDDPSGLDIRAVQIRWGSAYIAGPATSLRITYGEPFAHETLSVVSGTSAGGRHIWSYGADATGFTVAANEAITNIRYIAIGW